ncbi:MAG TPA: adenosylcobalamin-dependent ribonucleoside-diphosphate reductase, partial [Hyphomicrobiaceae bacterium]|nr:adenosylcobalamin-dependent ribonucleoside-diphosphate reductase [Hyphomicrobiaceae bacterium]
RILAGAGTQRQVTLFNCFVMGSIGDDLSSIFEHLREAALTMQQGGGIGYDFSTLRPKGALVRGVGADASGPLSFMDVWDSMCRTIMSAGARRGAMMATLRCDHPDIEAFVDAKADPARLRNFNLSVLVTDAFIRAVRDGAPWDLVFEGKVWRTVDARSLWDRIMCATYDYAEPGVVFIDRINAENNLAYCETISATNPCGEQPLPPYGACLLGSINLARLIEAPFTSEARLDEARLEALAATAVRFLDNAIDVSNYPLDEQRREAKAKRRIGLGVTGLADALILCGVRYGTPEAAALARRWMATIERAAYLASAGLAAEKGAFPLYDAERFLAAPNVRRLPEEVLAAIAQHGIRNGLLTSIAPTGTISLLAGNVSSGIEPVFDFRYERRVLERDGSTRIEPVEDYAHALYREKFGPAAPLGDAFVTAEELTPGEHLKMQAAVQAHVDSSISKTINCPADLGFEAFKNIYLEAYDLGLKGCTTYRPNAITGAVLSRSAAGTPSEARPPAAQPGVTQAAEIETAPIGPATTAAGPLPSGAPSPQPATGPEPWLPQGLGLPDRQGDVVYISKPLERAAVLEGATYKLRWPGSDHALYITINDIERDGHAGGTPSARRRPFEVFINTKNLEHYAWTVALTRMISAIFRRGGDVTFVVEELKAIFDPQGGQWMGGRYVPSLIAAIGEVIEGHMVRIGFLPGPAARDAQRDASAEAEPVALSGSGVAPPLAEGGAGRQTIAGGRICPRCSSRSLHRREGCWVCDTCGYSRCG